MSKSEGGDLELELLMNSQGVYWESKFTSRANGGADSL